MSKVKVRIILEAELDEEAQEAYPPDEPALAHENFFHYLRQGYLLYPLSRCCHILFDLEKGDINQEAYDWMKKSYDIDISIGRQFDTNFKVEFIKEDK
jgi:hypothetical protein